MQPLEIEILEKHTQALNAFTDALNRRSINVSDDKTLWTAKQCAEYLGIKSDRSFIEYTAPLPDFPRPVPIPSIRNQSNGQRRWIAKEVQDWALSNRDKASLKRKPKK